MRFENVAILGLAHVDAPVRVPSSWIDDRLHTALARWGVRPGLLEGLSGIAARRFFEEGTAPSDAAAMAAEKVLAETGLPRERIGVCVNTSVCRDYLEPSTACLVHGKIGLSPDCLNFDLGNACLAFLNGMDMVGNLIERGAIDYGLVVDGENSREINELTIARLLAGDSTVDDYRGQFASLTLGSGAAAMLLTRAELAPDGPRYLGCTSVAATEWNHLCRGRHDFMETDTRQLLVQGVALAQRTWDKAVAHRDWTIGRFDEFVLHQVSRVHTEQLTRKLGIPLERCLKIYDEYGNIGPAAVPITLSKAVEAGRVVKGSRVALMGIGSGLNCSMGEIVW